MTNKLDSEVRVCHVVGLSGVGGVQRNFVEYIECALEQENNYTHKVYSNGKSDSQYNLPIKIYNIKNLINLFCLILDIISRRKIVHFYNNLSSLKVAFLLLLIPVSNLIVHERGTSWNLPSKYGFILRFITWKSDLILANSNATKFLLEKKFRLSKNKIKVLYNGVNTSVKLKKKLTKTKEKDSYFYIGFIGRLDTPKGVHVLVEAMHKLANNNIKLIVAGDGPLRKELEKQSENLNNIRFVGRINDPYKFFDKVSLIVVPSIREPFGNVCIEAGLCRTPVLAANIDGIPEIITNYITGELIKPTRSVLLSSSRNALPLPEYVVDPINNELIKPMQIDSSELADKILLLSNSPKTLSKYSDKLYNNVLDHFGIESYTKKLHNIYSELIVF